MEWLMKLLLTSTAPLVVATNTAVLEEQGNRRDWVGKSLLLMRVGNNVDTKLMNYYS